MNATVTYTCNNCGAGLLFNAAEQAFCCEFCLSSFTEAELQSSSSAEKARQREEENAEFTGQVQQYRCQSCGAEVLAEGNTIARSCYYCHNPVLIVDQVSGAYKPSKIIPFKLDKNAAVDEFLRFVKKKRFVPKNYFSKSQLDYMSGVYYPFWVTDAYTTSNMSGIGKNVRTWRSGDYRYTETTTYAVAREGNISFEDITTFAISDDSKEMVEGVLPYPMEEYQDFSMPYLQGFVAKKRDIEREALSGEVRGRMTSYAETLLRRTASNYTHLSVNNVSVNVHSSHWEYSLLPVWIMTYIKRHRKDSKKDKTYMFTMNGSTGKLFGRLPVSLPKILALFLGLTLGVGALVTLLGLYAFFDPESLSASLFLGGAFGLFTGLIPTLIITGKYKKGLQSPIYPLDRFARLELTGSSDRFLNRTVTKVRINSNNNKK